MLNPATKLFETYHINDDVTSIKWELDDSAESTLFCIDKNGLITAKERVYDLGRYVETVPSSRQGGPIQLESVCRAFELLPSSPN